MARTRRPPFDLDELKKQPSAEARTRLLFDWWCDRDDQRRFLDALRGQLLWIDSRAHVEDDPAPPRSKPAPQGHAPVALISDPADVRMALSRPDLYSNSPYALLGGASFMLALDPAAPGADDWHGRQRSVARTLLDGLPRPQLLRAADVAVRQAAILSLRADAFDAAEFAEQAALRYFALIFGFAGSDHALLEDAARRGYRALQYLIVGRHFVSEAATLPAAQQAMARLSTRSAELMDEYAQRRRSPRTAFAPATTRADAHWPVGVQPWYELGLSELGMPLLARMPELAGPLSGGDLATLVGGLLVGTVGNVQTAVCGMLEQLLDHPETQSRATGLSAERLQPMMAAWLAAAPPVPFLPRRTRQEVAVRGGRIPAGTDCILALRPSPHEGCPWGQTDQPPPAVHDCIGRALIEPLLATLLSHTLALPNLQQRLDPLDGAPLFPQRLWGFGCMAYPLLYRRDRVRVQQPLIVVMPVKAPVAEHAQRLRNVIRSGAPRIQWLLDDSAMVHVAWFEFLEGDTQLALRTVYDGDFDTYVAHFALRAGDLFDQLFQSIEGAPPLPVSEHPHAFVETIRRFNRTPAGGFFYCAYPSVRTSQIAGPTWSDR